MDGIVPFSLHVEFALAKYSPVIATAIVAVICRLSPRLTKANYWDFLLPSSSIVHDDAGTIFIPVWSQLNDKLGWNFVVLNKFNNAIEIGLLHT